MVTTLPWRIALTTGLPSAQQPVCNTYPDTPTTLSVFVGCVDGFRTMRRLCIHFSQTVRSFLTLSLVHCVCSTTGT